ncbi:MAG: hypothetical protein AAGN82_16650 [Myxococcota bacterium]
MPPLISTPPRRALGAFLVTAATALVTSGCAENDATIFVIQLQLQSTENECVVTDEADNLQVFRGLYDPLCAFDENGQVLNECETSPYLGLPLVGNGMVARGNEDLLRAESNSVQIFGIEREVIVPGGGVVGVEIDDDASFAPAAGFVEVGSPSNPGLGITAVNLLTQEEAVAALQAVGSSAVNILVRFRLLGETLGGSDVETGIFDFPIEVRNRPARFQNCAGFDLTVVPEAGDFPCSLNQDEGARFINPLFDPRAADNPCFQ